MRGFAGVSPLNRMTDLEFYRQHEEKPAENRARKGLACRVSVIAALNLVSTGTQQDVHG